MKKLNIPTLLTLLRIIFIPFLIILFYLPFEWSYFATAILFGFAALTDLLDGYFARRLNQSSKLGAFLDPVADKLVVAVALLLLVGEYGSVFLTVPAAVIVSREIAVSALREWMAELGKRTQVAVSTIGKFKTGTQLGAIFLLLIQPAGWNVVVLSGFFLVYVAAALTLWSMVIYMKAAWPHLIQRDKAA